MAAARAGAAAAGGAPGGGLLERFRARLREAAAAGVGEEDEEAVVRAYDEVLAELTFNCKPIITELTIIAGQHAALAAGGIADAICARIAEVPADQKLPSLYLLDSIVKNIGREYVRHFAARLQKVFCNAYNEVHPNQYAAMRHLFGTWSQVFPSSVLRRIEDELQFSPSENRRSASAMNSRQSESPSPRPLHGIHVNPKYLEAQRQFKHTSVMHQAATEGNGQVADFEGDQMGGFTSESPRGWSAASSKFQHGKGVPPVLESQRQKSMMQYAEDPDQRETFLPHAGMARASLSHLVSTHPSVLNLDESLASSRRNMSMPMSPQTLRSRSPPVDMFPRIASPKRLTERSSTSHSILGHDPRRLPDQNGWFQQNWTSNDVAQQPEMSMLAEEYRKQNARELIDAYGNHRGKDTDERLPKLPRLDSNGMVSNSSARKWINSEEEEYSWEDMSPTLTDRNRRNSMPPSLPPGNMRIGFPGPNTGLLESDIGRRSWPGQGGPRLAVDEPSFVSGSGDVPFRRYPGSFGTQDETFSQYQSSHRTPDPGRIPNMLAPSGQPNIGLPLRVQAPPHLPSTLNRIPLPTDGEMPFKRLSTGGTYDPLNVDVSLMEKHLVRRAHSPAPGPLEWPPLHHTHPQTLPPIPPDLGHVRSAIDIIDNNRPLVNQGPNSSVLLPRHQYDAWDQKTASTSNLTQSPYQHPDLLPLSQKNQETLIQNQPQPQPQPQSQRHPHPQDVFRSFAPSVSVAPPQNLFQGQGNGAAIPPASLLPSSFSVPFPAVPPYGTPPVHGFALPPLPPGPPPASLMMGSSSLQVDGSTTSGSSSMYSGLLSNLVQQGVISLKSPNQPQDSLGVEFNADLKIRNEFAINALYWDLPRQCTTCGLRFKCQEEHRIHMDWHVTKNRNSKNHKQTSRKYFVCVEEWLRAAETVGTDGVPAFVPSEPVTGRKEEKEMAVPADEEQTVCALCAEPFEDFYSDELEEWMYKGAVYMNAPDGNIDGLERSQLGPIVHAKCRSGSHNT